MLLIYKDEILKKLAQEYPKLDPNLLAIVLFGSVSRGDYKPNSDIDVILVTKNVKSTRSQDHDSISRAYYAAFFAVKALLLLLGFYAKTHSRLITLFNLHVIKEGLLPKEIGKK